LTRKPIGVRGFDVSDPRQMKNQGLS